VHLGTLFLRRSLQGISIGALSVSLAVAADAPKAKKTNQAKNAKTTAAAPSTSGMVITKDPVSGQLEGGTLQQQRQLPQTLLRVGEPQPVRLPNGLVKLTVGPEMMSASTVTRNSDGTLSYQGFDSVKDAEAELKKKEADKEKANDKR
jgi:hypothetical protein